MIFIEWMKVPNTLSVSSIPAQKEFEIELLGQLFNIEHICHNMDNIIVDIVLDVYKY